MKRYFLMYESDKHNPFSNVGDHVHTYGAGASTIKTARSYINRVRKTEAQDHPRNFRIYDSYGDVDQTTDFVPCVYKED